jgi:hypothetical protein
MWVRDGNLETIQGTLDKIYLIIPKEHITVNIKIMKTVDIPVSSDKC